MDKELRRRNFEAKKLYEERRFNRRVETPKPIKEKIKRLKKQEILSHDEDDDFLYSP